MVVNGDAIYGRCANLIPRVLPFENSRDEVAYEPERTAIRLDTIAQTLLIVLVLESPGRTGLKPLLVWISDETEVSTITIDGATTFEIKATIPLQFESSLTTLLAETCQKVCVVVVALSSLVALPHAQRFRLKNWRLWGKTRDESDVRGHSFRGSTYMTHICLSLTGVDWVKLYKRSYFLMLLGSEGNCDTCKSFIKGLLNKMRQHFQKFLLSSLTLRRVIFAVNGLLGATFANFVQKRGSYSTFTYIPKSVFPCRLKLMSEETGIAATCRTKIWLNKFLTWRFIWLPKLMKPNLATVNRDSKASSARPEIAVIHKSCSPSLRADTRNVVVWSFLDRCRLSFQLSW